MKGVEVPVLISPGELIDKITILEIKAVRSIDTLARQNVSHELKLLNDARREHLANSQRLDELTGQLRVVNESLWDIEDGIRDCEAQTDFGNKFVDLARSVYRTNDRRAELKREINGLLGSILVEEKMYRDY